MAQVIPRFGALGVPAGQPAFTAPYGGAVVYHLDFSAGQHYIGYSSGLGQRLEDHRRRGSPEMKRLLSEEKPKRTALYRCSLRPLAEYYEELAIDAAMEAPTRRDLLNTKTP